MNFIGGVEGMNFTPITGYNNYLKGNAAFEVDTNGGMDFETILNNQTNAMQANPTKVNGGIEMNMTFDDLTANGIEGVSSAKEGSVANFMGSFGKAINSGLNSVNDATNAANRAQEALAMGEDVSVHDVMIASEKSALSLQMAMQLRNKLMTAYTEINNVKV